MKRAGNGRFWDQKSGVNKGYIGVKLWISLDNTLILIDNYEPSVGDNTKDGG